MRWRRARDAAVLGGLGPKARLRMTIPEQAGITLRRRRAEADLAVTRLVIEIQGRA